jgi:hypothetical protein
VTGFFSKLFAPGAVVTGQKGTTMATPAPPAAPAPTPAQSTSLLEKIWNWIKGEAKHVEAGIEDIFGSDVAQKIEAAGKSLIESNYGPLITAAIAEATDVVTGQMSVSKAVDALVALFAAESKSISKAAALQLIGVAQNALPANPATVTPAP